MARRRISRRTVMKYRTRSTPFTDTDEEHTTDICLAHTVENAAHVIADVVGMLEDAGGRHGGSGKEGAGNGDLAAFEDGQDTSKSSRLTGAVRR